MSTEFNFIDKTIQEPLYNDEDRYGEYPSQTLLYAWCDANDSITPRFIEREEWEEKKGDGILMDEDEEGKKILYLPKDLTLIETVDIVVAIDKDTYKDKPKLSTKGVEKIEELAQTFRKAGKYIEENLDKVDKGKNIAEDLSKKFSDYGYDLESRVKKVNKDIEVVPPVELTEEDRNKLDKWLVGGKIYTKRIERITGKKEPTPEEMEIHKEEIDRERKRFFKGYFKALASEGYKGEEEKTLERDLGPRANIQEKTKIGIENKIKGPEHQILESIFDRGLEGLLMELNVPQEKTKLYDFIDIPALKKELEEVRRNNPDNLDKISEVEREIAKKIHFAVASNYHYEESSFKPSEILKGDYLNCLGSTLVGTALLDEVGIKYLYVFPPSHSTTYLVTSNGKLYEQDFTPAEEPFTHRPDTFEITNDMFEDNVNILSLARTTDSFYAKFKGEVESIYITQSKKAMVAIVLNSLGYSYMKKGLYDVAIEAYKKAIELNPKNSDAYNYLGYSYNNLGQHNDAIEAYKKAIELNPNDSDAYNYLGYSYEELGEHNHAIEAYKKALELNPNNADTHYNLGTTYNHLEQHNHAIEAYKKALELNPNNADVYYGLGYSYNNLGQYNNAIEAYKKALELNPNNADASYSLGYLYAKEGLNNHAIEAYKKALSIQTSEIEAEQLPRNKYIMVWITCKNLLLLDPKNEDAQKYLRIAEREINSPT